MTTEWGEPPPTNDDDTLPIVHELVRADLLSRLEFGIAKYKTALRPRNGRDALKDAYEECVDMAVYLRQALWERENPPGAITPQSANVDRSWKWGDLVRHRTTGHEGRVRGWDRNRVRIWVEEPGSSVPHSWPQDGWERIDE